MKTYIGKCGEYVGRADDEIKISADNLADAMDIALEWSDDRWPESDGEYEAVVWLENESGEVLAAVEVEITADGTRS